MALSPLVHRLLFLCSGNYYRSRFAEILFNVWAEQEDVEWRADSRGLGGPEEMATLANIAPQAVRGLESRGISVAPNIRGPRPLREDDLAASNLIIAMNEHEHRPLLAARFPAWENKVEYWMIADLTEATPEETLGEIEAGIRGLFIRFRRQGRESR